MSDPGRHAQIVASFNGNPFAFHVQNHAAFHNNVDFIADVMMMCDLILPGFIRAVVYDLKVVGRETEFIDGRPSTE